VLEEALVGPESSPPAVYLATARPALSAIFVLSFRRPGSTRTSMSGAPSALTQLALGSLDSAVILALVTIAR